MLCFLLYEYVTKKYMSWIINRNKLHSMKIGKVGLYKRPPCVSKEESKRDRGIEFFPLTMEDYSILSV